MINNDKHRRKPAERVKRGALITCRHPAPVARIG
jgi:hypothetical protein